MQRFRQTRLTGQIPGMVMGAEWGGRGGRRTALARRTVRLRGEGPDHLHFDAAGVLLLAGQHHHLVVRRGEGARRGLRRAPRQRCA